MNKENIEERIIFYFEKKMTQEEETKLLDEVFQSDEAQSLFDVYEKIYGDFEMEELEMPSKNLENRFYQTIETPSKRIKVFELMKYAAAVLILITVGVLIGLNISKDQKIEEINDEFLALKKGMKDLLENESTVQRIRAVKMSYDIQEADNEILEVLIKTMNSDESENVRIAAIDALEGFLQNEIVKKAFVKTLLESKDDFIQIKLIRTLAEVKDKKLLPFFNKIIEDKGTSRYLKTEATKGKEAIINI